jgi:hypothetical protein
MVSMEGASEKRAKCETKIGYRKKNNATKIANN